MADMILAPSWMDGIRIVLRRWRKSGTGDWSKHHITWPGSSLTLCRRVVPSYAPKTAQHWPPQCPPALLCEVCVQHFLDAQDAGIEAEDA